MHRAGFGFQTLQKYFRALIASRLLAITKPSDRIAHPDCAERVAEIEAELRVMFDLVDD